MSSIATVLQRFALVAATGLMTILPAAAQAQNGIPATLQAVTPTAQQVVTSKAVQQPPGVVVRDTNGNPVRGVTVSFVPSIGGGSVFPSAVVSGSDGMARLTSWTAGSSAGTNSVYAKVARLPAVVFTATVQSTTTTTAVATRTAVPIDAAPRPSGPTINSFTISNGVATTADRDVTYQLAFQGSGALYRIGEGARSTGGWLIASGSAASGAFQLMSGPEGTRTLYLEIRKDATSPSSIRTASIQLKYPLQDIGGSGGDVDDIARVSGFSNSARKTNSSVGSVLKPGTCTFAFQNHMSAGDSNLSPFSIGISPETTCEFKLFSGRKLKPGWTLKAASVDLWYEVTGSTCKITSAAWGTENPEMTVVVRHPGSINPLDKTGTQCYVRDMVFRGPDDPNIVEGLVEALSALW